MVPLAFNPCEPDNLADAVQALVVFARLNYLVTTALQTEEQATEDDDVLMALAHGLEWLGLQIRHLHAKRGGVTAPTPRTRKRPAPPMALNVVALPPGAGA